MSDSELNKRSAVNPSSNRRRASLRSRAGAQSSNGGAESGAVFGEVSDIHAVEEKLSGAYSKGKPESSRPERKEKPEEEKQERSRPQGKEERAEKTPAAPKVEPKVADEPIVESDSDAKVNAELREAPKYEQTESEQQHWVPSTDPNASESKGSVKKKRIRKPADDMPKEMTLWDDIKHFFKMLFSPEPKEEPKPKRSRSDGNRRGRGNRGGGNRHGGNRSGGGNRDGGNNRRRGSGSSSDKDGARADGDKPRRRRRRRRSPGSSDNRKPSDKS